MSNICGACEKQFKGLEAYLEHTCKVSGATPKDIQHQVKTGNKNAQSIADAAIARGEARKALEAEGKSKEEAIVETRDIGKTVK